MKYIKIISFLFLIFIALFRGVELVNFNKGNERTVILLLALLINIIAMIFGAIYYRRWLNGKKNLF